MIFCLGTWSAQLFHYMHPPHFTCARFYIDFLWFDSDTTDLDASQITVMIQGIDVWAGTGKTPATAPARLQQWIGETLARLRQCLGKFSPQ
uniref:Uncharacterized protein n=1 Tax=Caenorhabditis japonica TaxID=281687 RepID=A0A8R1IFI7_CAEJA